MKNLSSYNQDLSIPRKKDLDALETKINGKQDTITGGASTITTSNLTVNRALISNSSGKVAVSTVTSTELGYLSGAGDNLQQQLDYQYSRTAEKPYYIFTTGTLSNNNIGLNDNAMFELVEAVERWYPYDDYDGYGQVDHMEPVLVCSDADNVTAYLKIANFQNGRIVLSGIYVVSGHYYQGLVIVNNLTVEYSGRIEITKSVNGKTGSDITLTASDVGAQPKITVNGLVQGDGAGNLSDDELNTASVGLGNVDNVKQYSATNPPPYPVTSVNGMTGAVTISELPAVGTADNGKFLRVVNGAWAADTVPSAGGVAF